MARSECIHSATRLTDTAARIADRTTEEIFAYIEELDKEIAEQQAEQAREREAQRNRRIVGLP